MNRINTEREQFVERRMKRSHSKRVLRNHVPVERLEMAQVKDDAMPLSDGTLVQTSSVYDLKQRIGFRPRTRQSCPQAVFKFFVGLLRKHLATAGQTFGKVKLCEYQDYLFPRREANDNLHGAQKP